MSLDRYEMVVGLEVHVQLKTRTKAFCACSTMYGAPPNVNTCPVCLALPGTLPVLNAEAVRLAVRAAHAIIGEGFSAKVVKPGVTTNEDLERLHPAVVRPGRCLARIEVGPLTRREAVAWLGTEEGVGREGATLAELRVEIP